MPQPTDKKTKWRNRIRDAVFKLPTDSEKLKQIAEILGIATDQ